MTYTYNNKGTCSVRTVVELNDDHTIKSVHTSLNFIIHTFPPEHSNFSVRL